jgi:hypothetical protein
MSGSTTEELVDRLGSPDGPLIPRPDDICPAVEVCTAVVPELLRAISVCAAVVPEPLRAISVVPWGPLQIKLTGTGVVEADFGATGDTTFVAIVGKDLICSARAFMFDIPYKYISMVVNDV